MDIHRTKTSIAIGLLVVAIFLILNFIVNSQPVGDWWLPLLLLLLAGLLLFVVGRPSATAQVPSAAAEPSVREFLLSDSAPSSPALEAAAPGASASVVAAAAEPVVIETPATVAETAPVVEAAAQAVVIETLPSVPDLAPAGDAAPLVEPAPAVEPVIAAFAAPAEPALEAPQPKSRSKKAASASDDLKRIEGIGPKMEKALNAASIVTFAQLADAGEGQLRSAIEAGGLRFAPSLGTWAKQARFLADGDESGFQAYIDSLTAGREGS